MEFEKVSFNQFINDVRNYAQYDTELSNQEVLQIYNDLRLPERSTSCSAGYDFFSPVRIYIPAKTSRVFPSGIKCRFTPEEGEKWHLKLYIRSSVGIKKHIVLTNGTGVIDADYYNNPDNEGDIFIALSNQSDLPAEFKPGDKIMQGIFEIYGKTYTDNNAMSRSGGIGSTGR